MVWLLNEDGLTFTYASTEGRLPWLKVVWRVPQFDKSCLVFSFLLINFLPPPQIISSSVPLNGSPQPQPCCLFPVLPACFLLLSKYFVVETNRHKKGLEIRRLFTQFLHQHSPAHSLCNLKLVFRYLRNNPVQLVCIHLLPCCFTIITSFECLHFVWTLKLLLLLYKVTTISWLTIMKYKYIAYHLHKVGLRYQSAKRRQTMLWCHNIQ